MAVEAFGRGSVGLGGRGGRVVVGGIALVALIPLAGQHDAVAAVV